MKKEQIKEIIEEILTEAFSKKYEKMLDWFFDNWLDNDEDNLAKGSRANLESEIHLSAKKHGWNAEGSKFITIDKWFDELLSNKDKEPLDALYKIYKKWK